MAKNISLLGADYPDVPAVQLPQTGGGTATFYDVTGHLIYADTYTTTADTVVPNNGMKEITAMANAIPSGAKFVSASLRSGTTAGLALLILHETYWGATKYLSAKNISGTSLTIPSGMVIDIVYMM